MLLRGSLKQLAAIVEHYIHELFPTELLWTGAEDFHSPLGASPWRVWSMEYILIFQRSTNRFNDKLITRYTKNYLNECIDYAFNEAYAVFFIIN